MLREHRTSLHPALGDTAASCQLMGEDLTLVGGPQLRAAADGAGLAALNPTLRPRVTIKLGTFLRDAHGWLRRHNRSVGTRPRGRAFVVSITAARDDYRTATDYVLKNFTDLPR